MNWYILYISVHWLINQLGNKLSAWTIFNLIESIWPQSWNHPNPTESPWDEPGVVYGGPADLTHIHDFLMCTCGDLWVLSVGRWDLHGSDLLWHVGGNWDVWNFVVADRCIWWLSTASLDVPAVLYVFKLTQLVGRMSATGLLLSVCNSPLREQLSFAINSLCTECVCVCVCVARERRIFFHIAFPFMCVPVLSSPYPPFHVSLYLLCMPSTCLCALMCAKWWRSWWWWMAWRTHLIPLLVLRSFLHCLFPHSLIVPVSHPMVYCIFLLLLLPAFIIAVKCLWWVEHWQCMSLFGRHICV